MVAFLLLLGLAAAAVFAAISIYNGLVTGRNAYKNAFSQIDVQLKRRHDLIPNLVETAKAYLKHERETLEAVVSARNTAVTAVRAAAANPGDPRAMQGLSYPDLKANQTMAQLMEELSSTENRISFARQAYNDAVMSYNNSRETFPGMILAGGFPAAQSFAVEVPAEREPVKVSF
jgi:LemA protein